MKVDELIKIVNENEFYRADCLYNKDTGTDLICELSSPRTIINYNKQKKFITGTVIYKCEDGYAGVTGPVILIKLIDWKDTNFKCTAKEYEEIVKIEYIPKEN